MPCPGHAVPHTVPRTRQPRIPTPFPGQAAQGAAPIRGPGGAREGRWWRGARAGAHGAGLGSLRRARLMARGIAGRVFAGSRLCAPAAPALGRDTGRWRAVPRTRRSPNPPATDPPTVRRTSRASRGADPGPRGSESRRSWPKARLVARGIAGRVFAGSRLCAPAAPALGPDTERWRALCPVALRGGRRIRRLLSPSPRRPHPAAPHSAAIGSVRTGASTGIASATLAAMISAVAQESVQPRCPWPVL